MVLMKLNYLVINIDTKKPTITRLPFASEGSPGSSNYWPGEFIQNDTIITTKHPTKDNDFSIQLKIEDPKNPDYSSGVLTVSANENTLSSERPKENS